MKLILLFLFTLAVSTVSALAQSSNGYLVVAPGFIAAKNYHSDTTLHFAAGGEGVLGKGVGIGVDLGYLTPTSSWSSGIGVFSANGYFHFIHRKDVRVDPFVTGGYSLLFRSGTENAFNFGAGANIWAFRHFGFRGEFRDHVDPHGSGLHYIGFRFGIALR